jgi:hypothetical protein
VLFRSESFELLSFDAASISSECGMPLSKRPSKLVREFSPSSVDEILPAQVPLQSLLLDARELLPVESESSTSSLEGIQELLRGANGGGGGWGGSRRPLRARFPPPMARAGEGT